MSGQQDFSGSSMLELFRMEVDSHSAPLNDGLVALANGAAGPDVLESLMRAAHSIKGAARIVGLQHAVDVAHAMEDCFVAAQEGKLHLRPDHVEVLLKGADFLVQSGRETQADTGQTHAAAILPAIRAVRSRTAIIPKAIQASTHSTSPALTRQVPPPNLGDMSLLSLFRSEVELHSKAFSDGMSLLERNPADRNPLEELRRAAHSMKGAARIVGVEPAARVAVALEDVFGLVLDGKSAIDAAKVTVLKQGGILLARIAGEVNESDSQGKELAARFDNEISAWLATLSAAPSGPAAPMTPVAPPSQKAVVEQRRETSRVVGTKRVTKVGDGAARAVRVNAASLSRLMGLAGETLIDAGWLGRYEQSLRRLQQHQNELLTAVERLHEQAIAERGQQANSVLMLDLQQKSVECQRMLANRVHEFEAFALRSDNLSHRLYREVIASRMRPFRDGIQAFPRMVHDLARSLGKNVLFEVNGKNTEVDRDILEKLEAPLNHLLRNALDHGMETPAERLAAGKKEQGKIVLEATHKGGMLFVTVSDDGRGIDIGRVRKKIIDRKMTTPEMAEKLTDAEVFEFLFLPGFSTAEKVTEISGRGVGLDVVHTMVHEVSGQLRVTSQHGKGCTFHVQLPLTLSVMRALLVEISGEPYAFPLARIDRVMKIGKEQILTLENHQFFKLDGQSIGLVAAHQVLHLDQIPAQGEDISIVIIGVRSERYGIAVDRVLGERDVVVRPLDARLGRVANISAAALMEDGAPLLMLDVEDMIQSIARLLSGGGLSKIFSSKTTEREEQKRILIVDDSLTVREVERKLLENSGYTVEVAIDGAEGWNAIRSAHYDLVITDVDMPRMNGLELVARIRADGLYKNLPVMIVSYKDREEDRLLGMEAGANYYLTKSSFHDESLLDAVIDLIGEPR